MTTSTSNILFLNQNQISPETSDLKDKSARSLDSALAVFIANNPVSDDKGHFYHMNSIISHADKLQGQANALNKEGVDHFNETWSNNRNIINRPPMDNMIIFINNKSGKSACVFTNIHANQKDAAIDQYSGDKIWTRVPTVFISHDSNLSDSFLSGEIDLIDISSPIIIRDSEATLLPYDEREIIQRL